MIVYRLAVVTALYGVTSVTAKENARLITSITASLINLVVCLVLSKVQRLFYLPLVWGEVRGFGGRVEAPQAPRPVRCGEGKNFDFWSPNSDFWCIVVTILRFSGLFWTQTAVA